MSKPTTAAKAILEAAGHQPRFYVPGSLRLLLGGGMEWDERCGSRCTHPNEECHLARSGRIPSGRFESHFATPPAPVCATPDAADRTEGEQQ